MALDVRASELEHSFVKERINSVGKHFDEISSKLKSYIERLSSLSYCGGDVAKTISSIASKETCNQTLRLSLGEFSDILLAVEEYRNAQAERTSCKVKRELENFIPLCKQTKTDVKKCFDARVKEFKKKNDLEKARSKSPPNWQKIAEKEVNQAQEEATRMTKEMGEIVESFERKKLQDLQHTFLEFTRIELIFHAKAIELYTKAFNVLKNIKVEEDLHEFNSHFKSYASSLSSEDLLPISHNTEPKTIDEDLEFPPPVQVFQNPQAIKGIQRTARSVFTLKTSMTQHPNSSSSFESINETN